MARPTLFMHRKFIELTIELKSRALALGSLELIWHAGYQSGEPFVGSEVVVEALADWRGKRGALVDVLVRCGFLDKTEKGYAIHDLDDHCPEYVKDRKRKERIRKERKLSRECPGTRSGHDQDITGNVPGRSRETSGTPTPTPTPTPLNTPIVPSRGDDRVPGRKARSAKTYTQEFREFWKAYPKRVAKAAAWRAWVQHNGDRPPIAVILSAIEQQLRSEQWQRDGGQYIPNPATWIRSARWDDELAVGPTDQPVDKDTMGAFLRGELT